MVFDTCWGTGASEIGTGQQLYINLDNPVQRRPKIDYFNATDVGHVAPTVSHISSNGYYGYCPTTFAPPTTNGETKQFTGDGVQQNEMHMETATKVEYNGNGHQGYQEHLQCERRKRASVPHSDETDDECVELKRQRRIHFNDIEDVQMIDTDDDNQPPVNGINGNHSFASSNIELNQQCMDPPKHPFTVSPKLSNGQSPMNNENVTPNQQYESVEPHFNPNPADYFSAADRLCGAPDECSDNKRFKSKCDVMDPNTIKNDVNCDGRSNGADCNQSSIEGDLEKLYWNTHGSMLWQR